MPPPASASKKIKYIEMREPAAIKCPVDLIRNPQTKLLRQATKEEIEKATQKAAHTKRKEIEKANQDAAAADTANADTPENTHSSSAAADVSANASLTEQTFNWVKSAETIANFINNDETDKYSDDIMKNIKTSLNTNKTEFLNQAIDLYSNKISNLPPINGGSREMSGGQIPSFPSKPILLPPSAQGLTRDSAVFPLIQSINTWCTDLQQKNNIKNNKSISLSQIKYCNNHTPTKYDVKQCIRQIAIDYKGKDDEQAAAYSRLLQKNPLIAFFPSPLSSVGMKQAEILGNKIKDKTILTAPPPPDLILCAATIPAMMTAYLTVLLADLTKSVPNNSKIYIVPNLNEKEGSEAMLVFKNNDAELHDFANYGLSPDIISEIGATIETGLFELLNYNIPPIKPTFDYTYYTGNNNEKIRESDLTQFFAWFDAADGANDGKNMLLKDKLNIWIFSHDSIIKEIRRQTFTSLKPPIDDNSVYTDIWNANTSVFQHKRVNKIIQPIFSLGAAAAPPLAPITGNFDNQFAQYGLIYYPYAPGNPPTTIRNKTATTDILYIDYYTDQNNKKLFGYDKPNKAADKYSLFQQLIQITHGENLEEKKKLVQRKEELDDKIKVLIDKFTADQQNKPYKVLNLDNDTTISAAKKAKLIKFHKDEYENEQTYINDFLTKYQIKTIPLLKTKTDYDQFETYLTDFEKKIANFNTEYNNSSSSSLVNTTITDNQIDLITKLEEEIKNIAYTTMSNQQPSANNLQNTYNKINDIKKDINDIKNKFFNQTGLDALKSKYNIQGGRRRGSRKKKIKKYQTKKSIRKNNNNKSLKKIGSKKARKSKDKKKTKRRRHNNKP